MLSDGNINDNYPYPVLGNYNDFDTSNLFSLRIRYGARNGQHEFTCNIAYDSFRSDYEKLVAERKIQYSILLFNAQTFYRMHFPGYEKEIRFNVPQDTIRGSIKLTGFMHASEPIEKFAPIGQSELYYGENTFDIETGTILAVSNTISHFIEPLFKKQNKNDAKHIIIFVEDKNLTSHYEVLEWGSDQLKVGIPKSIYQTWSSLITEEHKHIHHCALYLPILTDAINKIESEEGRSYEDYKWYHVIESLIDREEYPENMDPSVKAQKLMKGPFKPFVIEMDHIMETIIGGDE